MKGYWSATGTQATLTDDGFFDTGDLFSVDQNGFYFFAGRRDDMFICGGENIYPAEIERILEAHPEVETAVVVPVSDEIKGAKPYAFVRLRSGAKTAEHELKNFYLDRAPAFSHPRKIWRMDSFPLNGPDKIDRSALTSLAGRLLTDGGGVDENLDGV